MTSEGGWPTPSGSVKGWESIEKHPGPTDRQDRECGTGRLVAPKGTGSQMGSDYVP